MLDHAFLPDQYNRSHGFRVEITGGEAPDGNEGSWLSVSHSGISFEVETGSVTIGADQFLDFLN